MNTSYAIIRNQIKNDFVGSRQINVKLNKMKVPREGWFT